MTPSKIILSCLAILLLGYISLLAWDLTKEKPPRMPKPCPRVSNVNIHYNTRMMAWLGEFDTQVGNRPLKIIVGSYKSRDAVVDAIEWYCH